MKEARKSADELHTPDKWCQAWDDVTGREPNPDLARRPRAEEIKYFKKMKVYTKVSIEGCKRVTGKPPIGVR